MARVTNSGRTVIFQHVRVWKNTANHLGISLHEPGHPAAIVGLRREQNPQLFDLLVTRMTLTLEQATAPDLEQPERSAA